MSFWNVFITFSLLACLFILWPIIRNRKLLSSPKENSIDESPVNTAKPKLIVLLIMVLAVPALSIIAYDKLGAKDDWHITEAIQAIGKNSDASREDYQALALSISNRLDEQPENTQLWYYYAGITSQLGNYNQAARAYAQLLSLYPESALITAEYAQVMFFKADRRITDQVRALTSSALKLDPQQPTALGLAGIDAFEANDFQQAIQSWQAAVRMLAPNSPAAEGLSRAIAQAQLELEKSGGAALAKQTNTPQASGSESLTVKVSLQNLVKEKLKGSETVFVYARAWQGSKMPLAIQRFGVASLPSDIVLDKSMAMAPGMDITSFPKLELVARVSASGSAAAQSGDWIGTLGPITLAENNEVFSIVIDTAVP